MIYIYIRYIYIWYIYDTYIHIFIYIWYIYDTYMWYIYIYDIYIYDIYVYIYDIYIYDIYIYMIYIYIYIYDIYIYVIYIYIWYIYIYVPFLLVLRRHFSSKPGLAPPAQRPAAAMGSTLAGRPGCGQGGWLRHGESRSPPWKRMDSPAKYGGSPLVPSGKLTVCDIENGHWNSEFSHEKWWFSIVMLVYQMVNVENQWTSPFYSWVDQLFQWPYIQEQIVSLPEGSQG